MVLMRVSVVICFFVGISVIVYVVHGQWGEAGQSVFYGVLIFIVGRIALKDYHNRMNRRSRL